jgi:hypothetical protein
VGGRCGQGLQIAPGPVQFLLESLQEGANSEESALEAVGDDRQV